MKTKRKKFVFANKMHRDLFLMFFLAAFVPSTLITVSLYYLIFSITSTQVGIPEAIAYNILPASRKVFNILLFTAPLSILIILYAAYKLSHKIVGPYDRILRELDKRIQGKKYTHIGIRKHDKVGDLIKRINKLIDQIRMGQVPPQ